jgi:hypothetical protein
VPCLVGKSPEGSRQPGGEIRTPLRVSHAPRLGAHKPSYLRFLLTFGDRWCPLLSAVCPSAATQHGPTAFRSRLVADACGALVLRDQGPDRLAGYGNAKHGVDRPSRWCHVPVTDEVEDGRLPAAA